MLDTTALANLLKDPQALATLQSMLQVAAQIEQSVVDKSVTLEPRITLDSTPPEDAPLEPNVQAEIDALDSRVSRVESNVSGQGSQLTSLASSLASLQARVTALEPKPPVAVQPTVVDTTTGLPPGEGQIGSAAL